MNKEGAILVALPQSAIIERSSKPVVHTVDRTTHVSGVEHMNTTSHNRDSSLSTPLKALKGLQNVKMFIILNKESNRFRFENRKQI